MADLLTFPVFPIGGQPTSPDRSWAHTLTYPRGSQESDLTVTSVWNVALLGQHHLGLCGLQEALSSPARCP